MKKCCVCSRVWDSRCPECGLLFCNAHAAAHSQNSSHTAAPRDFGYLPETNAEKTSLMRAAESGSFQDVMAHMDLAGRRDAFGNSALFYALINGHFECSAALLPF